jgi:glycosyltransferase involved in cell wall biosynthesis
MSASLIVTYRRGAGDARLRNLRAVIARCARTPAHEVVLVEQDRLPTGDALPAHARLTRRFAFNPGAFNKGWGYNVGARAASGDVLAFCDADVLIGESLDTAIDACRRGTAVAKPYVRLIDLDADESAALCEGRLEPAAIDVARPGREAIGERIVLCGGVFVMRRDAFARLGGFDERFVGWGGEDDAMTHKVERARLGCVEFDREVALHLWHPRPREATSGAPHYARNIALLAEYARYDDTCLARLCEVQWQLAGNARKYAEAAA